MTMEELAKEAGVSISAVSKAFSGSHEVNETTRQKIFNLAKQNGCYYKYIKGNVKKPVIAIICNEIHSLVSNFIPLLQKEIKNRGGVSIIATDNFDKDARNDFIAYFAEHVGVDGIILCNSFGEVCNYDIPVIVIGGTDDKFSSVNITWDRAIGEALLHFSEYGHKKIAYIGEKHTFLKNDIFKEEMTRCGLPINESFIIHSKKRFEEAGYDGATQLLALSDRPTAILAAYDDIAYGAMKCLNENGLSIPEDISIIGMNDNKESRYLNVPLTTGSAYPEDMSEITTDLMFEKIKLGDFKTVTTIKVSSELIKRDSVGYAK